MIGLLLLATVITYTPDYSAPKGALNPLVSQDTIATTICQHGWTQTIRPTWAYTSNLKRKQMRQRHLPGSMRLYEEDHFIPLALGGAPSDPHNLWPEPKAGRGGAFTKDRTEVRLRTKVCNGSLTLKQAQDIIYSNFGRK